MPDERSDQKPEPDPKCDCNCEPPIEIKVVPGSAVPCQLLQVMVPVTTLAQLGSEAAEHGLPHQPADYIRAKLAVRPLPRLQPVYEAAQHPSLN